MPTWRRRCVPSCESRRGKQYQGINGCPGDKQWCLSHKVIARTHPLVRNTALMRRTRAGTTYRAIAGINGIRVLAESEIAGVHLSSVDGIRWCTFSHGIRQQPDERVQARSDALFVRRD